MKFPVLSLAGPLEDLSTLFSDKPVGTVADFDIDVDPDRDLIDPVESLEEALDPDVQDTVIDVPPLPSLTRLEPLTVWFLVRDLFGEEWYLLEPLAIADVLDDNLRVDQAGKDMISALQLIEVGDAFFTEWEVFNWVTSALAGVGADFTSFASLDSADMALSMLTAQTMRNLRSVPVPEYSQEVLSYIACCCLEDGMWALPGPLRAAQTRLSEILRLYHSDIPISRSGEISGAAAIENLEAELLPQRARCEDLMAGLQDSLDESRREIESFRRTE